LIELVFEGFKEQVSQIGAEPETADFKAL